MYIMCTKKNGLCKLTNRNYINQLFKSVKINFSLIVKYQTSIYKLYYTCNYKSIFCNSWGTNNIIDHGVIATNVNMQ